MSLRLLDSQSNEIRWRKIEQFAAQTRADIDQLMKRVPQRQHEWVGHLPHAEDAFQGFSANNRPFQIIEGILDGDLAKSTSSGQTETTATLSVWRGSGASWQDTGTNITVTNRSDTYSAKSGEYLQVYETESGEFRPLLFPSVLRLAKTDATLNKGATGTVSIYTGTALSESDTGVNATGVNKFANLGSGKWIVIARIDGDEYAVAGEC